MTVCMLDHPRQRVRPALGRCRVTPKQCLGTLSAGSPTTGPAQNNPSDTGEETT